MHLPENLDLEFDSVQVFELKQLKLPLKHFLTRPGEGLGLLCVETATFANVQFKLTIVEGPPRLKKG